MGITGLIPFMGKASKRGNIRQFSGKTVAIDAYCWLHKGAFCCADKIALGQPTDGYVKYCMKYVDMLRANQIKPILVFDGRHLPAKKETEVKRRENREANRRNAAQLMKMGQKGEAYNLLRRSIDISHEMALEVIKRCQQENVDCIVAPYEADAQLAYLNICGIADVVITEDSDLTLFGCKNIFFKMDINGNGVLVQQERLHRTMNMTLEHFDMEKFRYMCILSGCDYLPSLPGIGLNKACKFIQRNTEHDIHKALTRLGSYLNMKSLNVTEEYRDSFIRALITFKHQLVYCPLQRKQIRLHPPGPEVTEEQLKFAGDEVSEDVAFQLALGNYDPFTMRQLHNFDPDSKQKLGRRTNSWHENPPKESASIWSKNYEVHEEKENNETNELGKWPDTAGQVVTLNTETIKQKTTPKKRNFAEMAEELSTKDVLAIYANNKLAKNENILNDRKSPSRSPSPKKEPVKSPTSLKRANPFCKPTNEQETSPSLVCRGKRRLRVTNFVGFRTVIDEKNIQTSKYFSPNSGNTNSNEIEKIERSNSPQKSSTTELTKKLVPERKEITYQESNFIEEASSPEEPSTSDFFSGTSHEKSEPSLEENGTVENFSDEIQCTLESTNGESFRSSLSKWSNTKQTQKMDTRKPFTRSNSNVAVKKNLKKVPSRGKITAPKNDQRLLQMFGFEKKAVLKIQPL